MPHGFEKGIEFVFDKLGQSRPGLTLDLGQEGLEVFLYQLVEGGVFGTPPLVVDAPSILGRPAGTVPVPGFPGGAG